MANVSDFKPASSPFSNEGRLVRVVYDFALDAGAQGDLGLLVADSAVVVKLEYMRVITAGAGATMVLDCGKGAAGAEFLSAVAVANLTLDSMHLPSAPAAVELTSAEVVNMEIGTADLTAGKFEFVFRVYKK